MYTASLFSFDSDIDLVSNSLPRAATPMMSMEARLVHSVISITQKSSDL